MAMLNLHDGLDVLGRRTRIVRIALIVYIAISLFEIPVVAGELAGAIDIERDQLTRLDGLGMIVHLLFFVVTLVTVVLMARWIYRAHANLRAAEIPDLTFSPGWAVGWYFIPIACLFKPLEAMRELWAQSLARADSFAQPADPHLAAWWGAWIIGSLLSNLSMRTSLVGPTAGSALDLIATGALLAAGWFLRRIVTEVNSAQRSGTMMAHVFA